MWIFVKSSAGVLKRVVMCWLGYTSARFSSKAFDLKSLDKKANSCFNWCQPCVGNEKRGPRSTRYWVKTQFYNEISMRLKTANSRCDYSHECGWVRPAVLIHVGLQPYMFNYIYYYVKSVSRKYLLLLYAYT